MNGTDQTAGRSGEACPLFATAPTLVPSEPRCSKSGAFVSFAAPPLLTQRLVLHRPIESTTLLGHWATTSSMTDIGRDAVAGAFASGDSLASPTGPLAERMATKCVSDFNCLYIWCVENDT
ncbi:hypothetical protein D3C87_1108140 [compost metagenome]